MVMVIMVGPMPPPNLENRYEDDWDRKYTSSETQRREKRWRWKWRERMHIWPAKKESNFQLKMEKHCHGTCLFKHQRLDNRQSRFVDYYVG